MFRGEPGSIPHPLFFRRLDGAVGMVERTPKDEEMIRPPCIDKAEKGIGSRPHGRYLCKKYDRRRLERMSTDLASMSDPRNP